MKRQGEANHTALLNQKAETALLVYLDDVMNIMIITQLCSVSLFSWDLLEENCFIQLL